MPQKKIAVIGGGIAGMELASQLDYQGHSVVLIEKEAELGGNARKWFKLFPNQRPSQEVLDFLGSKIQNSKVEVKTATQITNLTRNNGSFRLFDPQKIIGNFDAVVITTGFNLFDARLKEEYGYGIYENVITSVELEESFKTGKISLGLHKVPERIGLVHCVGSRDEKCNNNHCSKVCCITAVKQAIEIRMMHRDTQVFCFYMDMRMFGTNYEELYRESQEKWGVRYIRGRVSEAAENADKTIQVKVEDTLTGQPLKINLDLLILLIGMVPSAGTTQLGEKLSLDFEKNGFIKGKDTHYHSNLTNKKGVFVAGTSGGPMNITDTINHARAAAIEVDQFLK